MKYLIFGKGLMGQEFNNFLEDSYLSSVDITDYEAVKQEIFNIAPEIVINCAAKTGKGSIDWCEENKLETLHSNVIGPLVVLRVCQELDKYFVHLSTGCIFNGEKEFSEEDEPNFFDGFYYKSKIWSDRILEDFDNVLILRLRLPIFSKPSPGNLITKLSSYPKVASLTNSITVVEDFLKAANHLMENNRTGIYHVTNPGVINYKEILEMYKEIVDPNHSCEFISPEELNMITKAKRGSSTLNTNKLEKEFKMRPVKEAIRETLVNYKESIN